MITETTLLKTINQLHEVKRQATKENNQPILRASQRVASYLEEDGIIIHDPVGEAYNSSRTDCEANLLSEKTEHLYIAEVIKPMVYFIKEGKREIIQRAVVIVDAQKK